MNKERILGSNFFTRGHRIEEELIGKMKEYHENRAVIDHSRLEDMDENERPFYEAKISQPEGSDPSYPKEKFAGTVHVMIAEKMNLAFDDVRFYTAGGGTSTLDKRGIDCWFEADIEGKTIRVTIDLTTNKSGKGADNPYESGEHKADIVFTVPSDGLDHMYHQTEFQDHCDGLATQIVNVLRERQKGIQEQEALRKTHEEVKATRPAITQHGGIRKYVSPEMPPQKNNKDRRVA